MDEKTVERFIERRHPHYESLLPHWVFCEQTYHGGKQWFDDNIFRYVKEGDGDYSKRVERSYRFNHTREVVDLVDKYLFKMEIQRNEDAPSFIRDFWKNSTLNNLTITDLMKSISRKSSIFGRAYVVIDSSLPSFEEGVSLAQQRELNGRVYAYIVKPENALDMSYDEQGKLNWILFHEQVRDDSDPFNSDGKMVSQYRLWTRTSWAKIKVSEQGNKRVVEFSGMQDHNLGVVPVVEVNHNINDEKWRTYGLVDDVVYLDKAVANYLSNIDQIIQDQTYSQLAMPAQGVLPGEDTYNKLLEMGTKRIFVYDGESNTAPFYLSPDVKQAELILKIINKIINEIYHTVGMAGERTKEDNAKGIDNSSGVAKAYDFERVNALLAAKADALELAENEILSVVAAWYGESIDPSERLVHYPDTFDVRSLDDEFSISAKLALVEAPSSLRREQMDNLVQKLFPTLKNEVIREIRKELESWPPDPLQVIAAGAAQSSFKKNSGNILSNELVQS